MCQVFYVVRCELKSEKWAETLSWLGGEIITCVFSGPRPDFRQRREKMKKIA